MYRNLLVVFLLITIEFFIVDSNNLGENDCCPLVWRNVIETSSGKVIPRYAIVAGFYQNRNKYYSWLPSYTWSGICRRQEDKIGIVTANIADGVRFDCDHQAWNYNPIIRPKCQIERDGVCAGNPNTPIAVLTNPYNCDIQWWERGYDYNMPDQTMAHLFPNLGNTYFARNPYDPDYLMAGNVRYDNKLFEFTKANTDHDHFKWGKIEFMYIDCMSSIPKLVSTEMYDVDFDLNKLLDGKEPVSLESMTIFNNSTSKSLSQITISAKVTQSLEMSHEESVRNSLKVSACMSVGFLSKMLNLGFNIDRTQEYETLARDGKIVKKTTEKKVTFKQDITTAPRSKTIVSVVSIPVQGRISYTATYRFKSLVNDSKLLDVKAALRRFGFRNTDQMRYENGSYIIRYQGSMSVQSGADTRIKITSIPLDGNSEDASTKLLTCSMESGMCG